MCDSCAYFQKLTQEKEEEVKRLKTIVADMRDALREANEKYDRAMREHRKLP